MIPLTERQREILETYAACNMNRTAAARRLYMCSSNIYYCFDRIKGKTNLDPRNPFDLVKLLRGGECVEVVRCKECKHAKEFRDIIRCCNGPLAFAVKESDFCSYGEKEDT